MNTEADEVAASVVRELATQPGALDAVVDRIATAVIARLEKRFELHPKSADAPEFETDSGDLGNTGVENISADAETLSQWAAENVPEWILGAPRKWATALIAASGETDPRAVLEWAHDKTCPTKEWRTTDTPLTPPKLTNRGDPRQSRYTQMLHEYRLSTHECGAATVGSIDTIVERVGDLVASYGLAGDVTAQPSWRRNAIELMRVCGGDADMVVDAITWAMRTKPHWRSNVRGVPAERTFRKLLADYRSAGGGFTLDRLNPQLARTVDELARGWSWYVAQTLGHAHVVVSTESRYRIWQLLTGQDGGHEVADETLKNVTRWIFDAQAGRARFYTVGESFPPPHKVRKALVDMAASRHAGGNGVGATNQLAGDETATRGTTTVTVRGV
ncbi:MAG: hypothetical protein L0H59_06235 [Tomitella sp.]|nr:hypothetical protein [Tomitella sp.]